MSEHNLHSIAKLKNIDILDEGLYSYVGSVFTVPPSVRHVTCEGLINKIEQFLCSAPSIQKAIGDMKEVRELIPRVDLLPQEIRELFKQGKAQMIPCKGSKDTFYLQIRSVVNGVKVAGKMYGKNMKIKDIPVSLHTAPADIAGAMQCLSMQHQLNNLADQLKNISRVCELNFGRLIQGQRDDRVAKLFSSRSCFLQALAISDDVLRCQMLVESIHDANSARAELAFQIRSDINLLERATILKSVDMEKIVYDLNVAIIAMNNAVQILLYSYQSLAEPDAQLSAVKEHEIFLKQVLLKKVNYKGKGYIAWDLICSSGDSRALADGFYNLPEKLINNCETFIKHRKRLELSDWGQVHE